MEVRQCLGLFGVGLGETVSVGIVIGELRVDEVIDLP